MKIEADDFRQASVVAKNEMIKFIRGKRLTILLILMVFGLSMITFVPYLMGGDLHDVPGGLTTAFTAYVPPLIIMSAVMFASTAIVSEFDERTALVLFTRPVKKTTIFLGKFFGSVILETIVLVLFYLWAVVACLVVEGGISDYLFTSFVMAFLFLLATTGIAMLISSVMKKSSLSTVLAFVLLMIMLPMMWVLLQFTANIDQWFMLIHASITIVPPVEDGLISMVMDAFGIGIPEVFTSALVMIAWAAVSMVLAWLAFIRREF